MAWRCLQQEVRKALETEDDVDVAQFIATATALTDKVSDEDDDSLMSAALLKWVEVYLAAHFCALKYPQYQQNKTLDASATYQGRTGRGLDGTWWGGQALDIDVTGYLKMINSDERIKVGFDWVGLPESGQTDFVDRD
jgi:hypothetical protein